MNYNYLITKTSSKISFSQTSKTGHCLIDESLSMKFLMAVN